jgi:preprotein translocase subunit SecB
VGAIETEPTQDQSGGVAAERASQGEVTPDFGYQLVDVYLYDCSVTRRQVGPDDPERPRFDVELESASEGEGFAATLAVSVTFRHRPEALCELKVAATGVFHQHGTVPDEDERVFRGSDCAVLLWPYARAYVGELGRMLDIDLPPLPVIDVRDALARWHAELPDNP